VHQLLVHNKELLDHLQALLRHINVLQLQSDNGKQPQPQQFTPVATPLPQVTILIISCEFCMGVPLLLQLLVFE
jgi:hypothetical protein